MDLDGSRELESTSMDVDDSETSCIHPQSHDSAKMDSSGPSIGPSLPGPSFPGSAESPELPDVTQGHLPARQRRDVLPSLHISIPGVTSRKRKHSLDESPHADRSPVQDNDPFAVAASSSRRTRPRLQARDRKFTPFLIMSPSRECVSPAEETISASHYSQNMTNSIHSFQPAYPHERDSRMLQGGSLPTDDLDGRQERARSDLASSGEVAPISPTAATKHSSLSTLSDISLPRPFEDVEMPPSSGSTMVKVHERGIDAVPSFTSSPTRGGRTGGLWAPHKRAGLQTGTLGRPIRAQAAYGDEHVLEFDVHLRASSPWPSGPLASEPSTTKFFDKPICDSPEEMDSHEDGSAGRGGPRVSGGTHGSGFDFAGASGQQ